MTFFLQGVGILVAASLLLGLLVWLIVLAIRRRRPRRFWKRVLVAHLLLVPVYAFVVMPGVLGYLATHAGTRGDEAAYAGPRFAADGRWLLQSRESLRTQRDVPASVDTIALTSADGTSLRAFLVAPQRATRRLSVVLVHGLFRGGLELEPVASMFRDLGVETLSVELRNHGGSGRGVTTFGLREADDVLAAVAWLRSRSGHADDPVVLFGVSLGSVAVALAAPRVRRLAGLVLDAPLDDLQSTGERMLNLPPRAGRRRLSLPQPFRALVLHSVELWAGIDLEAIAPPSALRQVPPDVPALIIGGGDDLRAPPEVVRQVYDALLAPPGTKELWIREGSDHGSVWTDDPAGYKARLTALLERAKLQ